MVEALSSLCRGQPESSLRHAFHVTLENSDHATDGDVLHPDGERHYTGFSLHYAGTAPSQFPQHGPHGVVLEDFQTLLLVVGECDEDQCTVIHQGAHSLHVVQSEDRERGASAGSRHGPHHVQPGLRPFLQVGDLGRE